jgi:hypothetical protein
MIESGTMEEIKQSILGNLTFQPNTDTLDKVKKCFEGQELKVLVVTVKHYQCGKGNTFCQWPVVVVTFTTKRPLQGAFAKTMRAIRAARLSMYQFNDHGKREDGTHCYAVELRENE